MMELCLSPLPTFLRKTLCSYRIRLRNRIKNMEYVISYCYPRTDIDIIINPYHRLITRIPDRQVNPLPAVKLLAQ